MNQATIDPPANLPARQNGNGNGGTSPIRQKQSALSSMAERFAIEPTRLMSVLKATVIKGTRDRQATDEEVAAFIVVANQYGLNPFCREIHAFCDGQRGVVPIVGIDGWSHIVNAEPRFDGCQFEEVKDGDDIGVRCTMHVKDRSHPTVITEWLSECKRNTPPWTGMKRRMLRHKAFMQCARYAFSISGIYDEDEARDIMLNNVAPTQDQPQPMRGVAGLLNRVTSKPVSEGQTFEVDQDELARQEALAKTSAPLTEEQGMEAIKAKSASAQQDDVKGDTDPAAEAQRLADEHEADAEKQRQAPAGPSDAELVSTVEGFWDAMNAAAASANIPEKELQSWVNTRLLAMRMKGQIEKTSVATRIGWLATVRSGQLK